MELLFIRKAQSPTNDHGILVVVHQIFNWKKAEFAVHKLPARPFSLVGNEAAAFSWLISDACLMILP